MLEIAALAVFPSLMAFAASSDLFTMTISNRITLALAAAFFVMAMLAGASLQDIAFHAACGMAMLVITFTLFAFGWIGGGDAKLAAATALWLGWQQMLDYGITASILGGGLTLGIILIRRYPLPAWGQNSDWIARLHDQRNGVPYGIALAAAGLMLYPQSLIWSVIASV